MMAIGIISSPLFLFSLPHSYYYYVGWNAIVTANLLHSTMQPYITASIDN